MSRTAVLFFVHLLQSIGPFLHNEAVEELEGLHDESGGHALLVLTHSDYEGVVCVPIRQQHHPFSTHLPTHIQSTSIRHAWPCRGYKKDIQTFVSLVLVGSKNRYSFSFGWFFYFALSRHIFHLLMSLCFSF